MRRFLFSVLMVFVVFVLMVAVLLAGMRAGWVQPDPSIGNGIDKYSGVKREQAENAIWEAKYMAHEYGSPGFLSLEYRVTSMKRCPENPLKCTQAVREKRSCAGEPFAMEVQTYTVFGLPFGKWSANCGGTMGYGVF